MEIMPGSLLYQLPDASTSGANAILNRAGFDAIDTGRDVQQIKGTGIRQKGTKLDPDNAESRDIFS